MIKKFLFTIYKKLCISTMRVEAYITTFAIILSTVYLGFYFFNRIIASPSGEENLFLRIIISILGISLIYREHWPEKIKPFIPIYWYFTLWFSLPLFFTYMLFQNLNSNIWQINMLVGLVILTFFVDWIQFLILVVLGFLSAILICKFLDPNFHLPKRELIGIFGSYSAPILYFITFSNKKEQEYNDKLQILKALGGSIAHELRTPVGALGLRGKGLATQAIKLLDVYKLAKDHNLPISEIREREIKKIENSYQDIENITNESLLIIDMLLTKLKDPSSESQKEIYSIKQVVEEALDRYPLYDKQKDLIHLRLDEDFAFYGNKTMFSHVIFNLLKNALHYIRQENKGEIIMTLEKKENENILYFRDTAKGIREEMLSHMFKKFYSRTEHGTGLGLAFCKQVMEEMKGKIMCNSVYGEYTEFVLTFPLHIKTYKIA